MTKLLLILLAACALRYVCARQSRSDTWYWCDIMTGGQSGGLFEDQFKLCLERKDIIRALDIGSLEGIMACEKQFAHNTWNCSQGINYESSLHYWIADRSREDAYIQAIRPAAMVLEIGRWCAKGLLPDCNCSDRPAQNQWQWSGCKTQIDIAESIVRSFLSFETFYNASKEIRLMNEHNTRLGIEVVKRSLRNTCFCHGVSGSCTHRTCVKALSTSADLVAQELKGLYKRSQKGALVDVVFLTAEGKTVAEGEMLHLNKSPNPCRVSPEGRECVLGADEDTCSSTCCNRGWHDIETKIDRPTNCSANAGVALNCDITSFNVTKNYCN